MDHVQIRTSPEPRTERGQAPSGLGLSLIGGFGLWNAADPIALPTSAQRVVAYVALRDRPSLRAHVAASLWLDTPEDRALANLRSALWRLRRPGLLIVELSGDQIWLASHVRVDIRELTHLARAMLAGGTGPESPATERLTLAGEILPGWYDDWVFVERERFRHLRLHALERACLALARAGEYGRAIDAGLAAVAEEPLRESSHRGLIEAHLAEGNRVEALRQFETYRRLMHDELGLPPSPAMLALVHDVLAAGARVGQGGVAGTRTGGEHGRPGPSRSGDQEAGPQFARLPARRS